MTSPYRAGWKKQEMATTVPQSAAPWNCNPGRPGRPNAIGGYGDRNRTIKSYRSLGLLTTIVVARLFFSLRRFPLSLSLPPHPSFGHELREAIQKGLKPFPRRFLHRIFVGGFLHNQHLRG